MSRDMSGAGGVWVIKMAMYVLMGEMEVWSLYLHINLLHPLTTEKTGGNI
jgi:hypothetical protein